MSRRILDRQNQNEPLPEEGRQSRIRGRFRRIALRFALGLAALLVLVPLSLLAFPPLREGVFRLALNLADERLPGRMQVARVDWGRLGRLRLDGCSWIAGGDTLVSIAELDLMVDLGRIFSRQVAVEHLLLSEVSADLPALRRYWPRTVPRPADEISPTAPEWPPDLHALAPSLDLRRLRIEIGGIRLDERNRIGSALLEASLNLSKDRPSRLRLDSLRARDAAGLWELESIQAAGDLDSLVLDAALQARWRDLRLRWSFDARLGEALSLAAAPLELKVPGGGSASESLTDRDGILHFDPADSTLRVERLRITGDLGDYRLDAVLDRELKAVVDIRCRWRRSAVAGMCQVLPPAVKARMDGARLSAAWSEDEQAELALHIELDRPGGEQSLEVAALASFALPGPRQLAPLLPPEAGFELEDWGFLQGKLELAAGLDIDKLKTFRPQDEGGWPPDLSGLDFELTLDLGDTKWLEEGRLELQGRGRFLAIDTLRLVLPGLRCGLAGDLDADSRSIDLDGRLEILDRRLLARFGSTLRDIDGRLDLAFGARGELADPQLEVRGTGGLQLPGLQIPRFELELLEQPMARRLDLRAPEGLLAGDFLWDRLDIALDLPAEGLTAFPLRAEVRAASEEGELALIAGATLDTARVLDLEVEDLALRLGVQDLAAEEPFSCRVDPAAGALELAGLCLRGELGAVEAEGWIRKDTLALAAWLDLAIPPELLRRALPATIHPREDQLTLALEAQVDLTGRPEAPRGSLAGRAALMPAEGQPGILALAVEADLARTGITAQFDLLGQEIGLLRGELSMPGRLSREPAGWISDSADPCRCEIVAPDLQLEALNPFLPRLLDLNGVLSLELRAQGMLPEFLTFGADTTGPASIPELALAGGMQLVDFETRVMQHSRLAARCEASVEGSTRHARVRGRFETVSGLIELPPAPPRLHPTEGAALLLESAAASPGGNPEGSPAPAVDSLAAASAGTSSSRGPAVDLDLELLIPGEIWVQGRGLKLELGGDLHLRILPGALPTDPPAVSGTVELLRGGYKFMGRRFEVERGEITLYGQLEPDPDLDIVLRSELPDAIVRIVVSGSARDPLLSLSSEPELSEGEILSLLMTGGGAAGEVDAGALLTGLGLAELQQRVAGRLGLDTVEYHMGGGEGDAGSLVVGKYLSPRLMIRYEQGLGEASAFLVKLDYLLSRRFKLETSYAAGGESGVEVFWTREK